MNPEKLLMLAEQAIIDRPPSRETQFHLCDWHGFIKCLPARHTHDPHEVFMTLGEREQFIGLTPMQWTRLKNKLAIYYTRRDKWPQNKLP